MQLLSDASEEGLNALARFTACLVEGGLDLFRVLRRLLYAHRLMLNVVDLARHKRNDNLLRGLLLQLVHPESEFFETFHVRGVVHQTHSVGVLVVDGGQGPELFAASRVPDLQLNADGLRHVCGFHGLDLAAVVGSDSRRVLKGVKGLLDVSVHNARLPHT